jgi:hypothetical protein
LSLIVKTRVLLIPYVFLWLLTVNLIENRPEIISAICEY